MTIDGVTAQEPALILAHGLLDQLSQTAEQEILPLLAPVQADAIRRNVRSEDRRRRLLVRLLLAAALSRLEGWSPASTLARLAWDDKGRPILPGSGWAISFSHSGDAGLCLLGRQEVSGQVGIDVETIRNLTIADVALAFCDEERRAIQSSADRQTHLFRIWCRKEAVLKMLGTGLMTEPARVNVLAPIPWLAMPGMGLRDLDPAAIGLPPDRYGVALAAEHGRILDRLVFLPLAALHQKFDGR